MIKFIESPLFENWFKNHIPQNSLLICSPYIKKHALDKIFALYDLNHRIDNINFRLLLRGNTEEFTSAKSSDISIFDSLLSLPNYDIDNIKRITNLHMKAYLIDDTDLLITSGNLTNNGILVTDGHENFEGGIYTTDTQVIEDFKHYFDSIWQQAEPFTHFASKIYNAYSDYIKNEYSDKTTIKRINRQKFAFPIIPTSSMLAPRNNYALDDLPPVGNVCYLNITLQILANHPEGLSYLALGKLLRNQLHLAPPIEDPQRATTDNRKFGEEKGKFLSYFGLARLSSFRFYINEVGKKYLTMNLQDQQKLLKDLILSKPFIQDIILHHADPDFNLDKLLSSVNATSSTLVRRKGAINTLLDYLQSLSPETELLEILNQLTN